MEILPLQYRSQVQSGSNLVFWFLAFIAVYFGGQAASDPKIGPLIYIWFCLGGGLITTLSWFFVVESESTSHSASIDQLLTVAIAKDLTLEQIDHLWIETEDRVIEGQGSSLADSKDDKDGFRVKETQAQV